MVLSQQFRDCLRGVLAAARANPRFSCSPENWLALRLTVLPENYAEKPCRPVKAAPGTAEKHRILKNRACEQQSLFHEKDPRDDADYEKLAHTICPAKRREKKAQPRKPTPQEIDEKRRQMRLWNHPGMIRMEDALAPSSAEPPRTKRPSEKQAARCHAG